MSLTNSFQDQLSQQRTAELFVELKKQMPDIDGVKWFIGKTDMKAQDGISGNTPLMLVAGWGNIDLMKQMIAAGADVNQQDRNGNTVVHFVLRAGNEAAINLVLEKGGNIALPNGAGSTPFDFARGTLSKQMLEKIQRKFEEQDPDNMRRSAFRKYINQQGVRTSKDLQAPQRASFKPRV